MTEKPSRRLRLSYNFINNEQWRSTMKTERAFDINENGPSSHVVGQYYTLYDGVPKERYESIVASAPFDKCNLVILGFVPAFEYVRSAEEGGTIYVAQLANGRVTPEGKNYPVDPSDTDGDRVKLIVQTARKKNPSINILISLGWGTNDAGKAALAPVAFADSVRTLVQAYELNGFDIDFESTNVTPAALLALAKEIRRSLNKIPSTRPMIMTITPAIHNDKAGLNGNVLEQFTYVMPQTYIHGGDGTDFADATWLAKQLDGSYSRIVYGLNSEGNIGESDNPRKFADKAKANRAAGIFAWRLNGDSVDQNGSPTFATSAKMWKSMNQQLPNPKPRSPRHSSA
jgi:GH18 family chitinase